MAQPIWNTPAGTIGSYPSKIALQFQMVATPVSPAISIQYSSISGNFPEGLVLSQSGLISGIPNLETSDTTYIFVIRATDNLGNIRDRTFSMVISGVVIPEFTTSAGSIGTIRDSTWVSFPIEYSNPISSNVVSIRVVQGQLPIGLEINKDGLIRGYASPPTINTNLGSVNTTALSTNSETNEITCLSTAGFQVNRPIVFSGTVIGGITAGQTYFVRTIINESRFTISSSADGSVVPLISDAGNMDVALPNISVGRPTVRTFSFTLRLDSEFGSDIETYSITVENQNAPVAEGGLGLGLNTRPPTIYNTRPATFNIANDTVNFGYYVLPNSSGATYDPAQDAFIGRISSDNIFSFRILGKDFDGDNLTYTFENLPLGLIGDPITGWISGNPEISSNNISEFSFRAAVAKTTKPAISTPFFNFSFRITNDLIGDVDWITPENLGIIENGTLSTLSVEAESDVQLEYRIVDGNLPPNLFLLPNGEITGTVAYQPTDTFLLPDSVTDFTFTIQAFAPIYPVVLSNRTFVIRVVQEYTQPTDTLYIKCTPSIEDRKLLKTLLENDSLIPADMLYRSEDSNFGKASSVTYAHAYGIHANFVDAYIDAVSKNHYWRNITLGELKTAIARNDNGEIIYEVVYSQVIDNLNNSEGVSVSEEIFWPRLIDLNLGPWYTSVNNLYTSYIGASIQGQSLLTENNNNISTEDSFTIDTESGQPAYYTSLSSGVARILYPNSLSNMNNRVGSELGQDFNFSLYPKWMTSQQRNGSTLGFTPAWVICYTKPSITLPDGTEFSYANEIKNNIENNWKDVIGNNNTLNQINFKIDRFTVDKSATYDYDTLLNPPAWLGLPSATPVPNPKNKNDFHVLFPKKTILPN